MPAKITESELNTATKLAGRKAGVTRAQLAEKLNIGVSRAAKVLARISATAEPLGAGSGKQNRTLVFRA